MQTPAPKKKKILVICQHFWPENFRLNDICDFLVEKDCEVDVLCGIPNYPKGVFFEGYSYFKNRRQSHNGVTIRRAFEMPRGSNSHFRIFLNYISFPLASLFHIPRLLAKDYDKIYIYQLSPVMMSLAGILLGKLKKTEVIMHVLDLWPENLFSVITFRSAVVNRILTAVSHWHYRQPNKLVALSSKMRDQLLNVTNLPENDVIELPQACEKVYEADIHDKQLEKKFKDTFNVVFAGNISPAQSFETIVETAQRLKDDGLDSIRWIIVGDGMSRQKLEATVKEKGLADRFSFEGTKPMEDIPAYTAIADVLVGCLVKSALLEATIPAKVLSYVAAGRPIVLAMDGEAQDLVNNVIKCGYAGPAGDADQLYQNINKMYHLKPIDREKFGKNARAYHFKHLERSIVLNRLYDFIFR